MGSWLYTERRVDRIYRKVGCRKKEASYVTPKFIARVMASLASQLLMCEKVVGEEAGLFVEYQVS